MVCRSRRNAEALMDRWGDYYNSFCPFVSDALTVSQSSLCCMNKNYAHLAREVTRNNAARDGPRTSSKAFFSWLFSHPSFSSVGYIIQILARAFCLLACGIGKCYTSLTASDAPYFEPKTSLGKSDIISYGSPPYRYKCSLE